MAPKSIYRRPDAQHFQLVHRSQRDPLIHDADAGQHVFKPFQRENDVKKVRGRAFHSHSRADGRCAARDDLARI